MSFATRLRVARLVANLTQQETALIAGITRHEWSRMECGHGRPDIKYGIAAERTQTLRNRITAMARAVNVTPEHLLGEE